MAIGIDRLNKDGWVSLECEAASEHCLKKTIVELAREIGTPIASRNGKDICEKLRPTEADKARLHSLSKIYSLGSLPLHVDTAHWVTPCRFIILACLKPGIGNRSTILLDTRSLGLTKSQSNLLYNTPLRIENGRCSFFGTVLSTDRTFMRYDPGCMKAVCPDGNKVLDMFKPERWSGFIKKIDWHQGKVVIIDNWRLLHGRGSSIEADGDRVLLRVLIQ